MRQYTIQVANFPATNNINKRKNSGEAEENYNRTLENVLHILNQTFVDLKNHLESEIQNRKHNVKNRKK